MQDPAVNILKALRPCFRRPRGEPGLPGAGEAGSRILQPVKNVQHLMSAEKRGAGLVSPARCGSLSAVQSAPALQRRRDPRR
jgi:hypothetical protein